MGIVVIGAVFVDIKGFPLELRPTFLSIVDDSALGEDVIRKLQRHKVNTEYVQKIPEGMGTWLAVFDNDGDLAGSISQRPNLMPILGLINEIFKDCDSIVLEADIDPEIIKAVLDYSKKYNKKVFGVISNMTLAVERRDLLQQFDCLVCNELEAGIFFAENYSKKSPKDLCEIIYQKVSAGAIKSMVVTMGSKGSIYADHLGNKGICPAKKVTVRDTTGAGDAFCAGLTIGLTYRKELSDAVEIGTKLAASVITSSENVCPRFLPRELGLDMDVSDC